MKFVIALFSAALLSVNAFSQSLLHPGFIELDAHEGYLVKNYPSFPERHTPPYLITGRYGIKLNGSSFWHRFYRYPDFSFQFGYGNFGNKNALGDFYFIVPELALSQSAGSHFRIDESAGLGISCFTKTFNPVTDSSNILIGSRLTFMPSASLAVEYSFSKFFSVMVRGSIHHASNSHYKLPNLGANLPSVGIGIRYRLHEVEINKNSEPFATDKRFHFNVRFALGINQRGGTTDYVGDKHYSIYLLQFYWSHNYHEITRYQIGLEAYYNTGVYDTVHTSTFYSSNQRLNSSCILFTLGHEFLIGHFSLCTQGGIFIFNPYHRDIQELKHVTNTIAKMESLFLARLGFNYYFKNAILTSHHQLFAGVYIKTNCGRADFLESTVGFMF